MPRRKQSFPNISVEAVIESLSPEGRGVAHIDGKTTFIDGALPGETVRLRYLRRRHRFDEAVTAEVIESSAARVEPECRHFGACGGCRLQHMDGSAQIQHKQWALLEQLRHIGQVEPKHVRLPITGPAWGYRHKARLGVKYVEKKSRVLVGFRERNSRYIAELESCPVLHPAVGESLSDLSELLHSLSIYRHVPQIEVAVGEAGQPVLIIRHLEPLMTADRERLVEYEKRQDVTIYLQAGGPDSVEPLRSDNTVTLNYSLPVYDIDFTFTATDFTQVNPAVNRDLIDAVVAWLQPEASDRILDLFCGLGNFSLPLARRAGWVTGVEGEPDVVARAQENAVRNQFSNIVFISADLMNSEIKAGFMHEPFNKVVLDPPRSGAAEIIAALDWQNVEQVAYVSCNPATLARDAGVLVREYGFVIQQAGVLDMFPHTAHVESLALFKREV